MIHNHILRIVKIERIILFGGGIFARAYTQVTDDDVALFTGAEFAAVNGNSLARSRLPCNRDIALDRNGRFDVDDTTHIKNDNAVSLAHRITERTCAT